MTLNFSLTSLVLLVILSVFPAIVRAACPGDFILIAHRGVVTDAFEENSLDALEEAIRRGYTHVEVDIRVTSDGHLACIHDADLKRTHGIDAAIHELTLAQLHQRIHPDSVPTFERFCARSAGRIALMPDVKGCPETLADAYAKRIVNGLKKHDLLDSALFIGKIGLIREITPRGRIPWRGGLERARSQPWAGGNPGRLYFVFAPAKNLDRLKVDGFRALGLTVIASINYGHYPPGEAVPRGLEDADAMLELGVDGVQIDSEYEPAVRGHRTSRGASAADRSPARPVVIAHRGASAYLPEHTLAAKAMAHAMGADFIEQDIVLTKDDHPIIFHDTTLDSTTDVSAVFPGRARDDGRYHVIDFTLDEVRRLTVSQRRDLRTGRAIYPNRFPVDRSRFVVATLAEEIELIRGLNKSTGRSVGLYVELKEPGIHRGEGKDIAAITLDILARYGYSRRSDNVYLQCFDTRELQRIRNDLGCDLKLVQLIDDDKGDQPRPTMEQRLREIAVYADAVGPGLDRVISGLDETGRPVVTPLVRIAHQYNLEVHPYTYKADDVPPYASDFEALLHHHIVTAGIDGLFTDHPDRASRFIDRMNIK